MILVYRKIYSPDSENKAKQHRGKQNPWKQSKNKQQQIKKEGHEMKSARLWHKLKAVVQRWVRAAVDL
jgi:hypothetical protein